MVKKTQGFKIFSSGQALLTFILVMAVGLTIGLALVSRSVQDIKLSTEIEESSRAFSAAEAGIEESLQTGIGIAEPREIAEINASYKVTLTEAGGSDSIYEIPGNINSFDTQTVWLVEHQDEYNLDESSSYQADTLTLCWSKANETDPVPALEVSIIYNDLGSYKIVRGAYDPDPGSRASPNNFDLAVSGGCPNYQYSKELVFADFGIPAGSTLVTLRIRPIYSVAKIAVDPPSGASLPIQGKERVALGKTESGVTVKIIVYESYPSLPEIFDYALFSGASLQK